MILRADAETKTVVIIDWERSGWYPSFWGYGSGVIDPLVAA
jgi:hypothetical protein